MTPQFALTIGREALTLLLMISMPLLGVVMAVGLLVSIFQAVTQIHEATLAFVPKLIAAMDLVQPEIAPEIVAEAAPVVDQLSP